jgi:hypothetical protein
MYSAILEMQAVGRSKDAALHYLPIVRSFYGAMIAYSICVLILLRLYNIVCQMSQTR